MRVCRWLLRRCPLSLRQDLAGAMEDTIARRLADARRRSRARGATVCLRELGGLIALALAENWELKRVRRRRDTIDAPRKAGAMDEMTRELRHAARRLMRSPAFTLTAVATLALAIAANVSIFAVVHRVLLNPLPYPDADRLIELNHGARRLNVPAGMGLTVGLSFHYAERARTLEDVAIYRTEDQTITGDGEPARIRVTRATPSLQAVLRVAPALGRWFSDAEGRPGGRQAAVLSHGLWVRRYGQDERILGRPITIGGVPMIVVGVMPATFAFPDPGVDAWAVEQTARASGFGLWLYQGVARMRDGPRLADVRAELNALIPDVTRTYPDDQLAAGNAQADLVFTGRSLKDATVGQVERGLWILFASVAIVLLVACANVANLFLVRSEARVREVAVRRALGAGRLGIARYFLTESLLLSLLGGVAGLALAWGVVRLLVTYGPATLPRLHEIQLDGVALGFTLVLCGVVALPFGAIPLWRRGPLAVSLHDGGRSQTASRSRHHSRQALLAMQVALALVLLVSSGLMARSFLRLRAFDPGFDASSALVFDVGLAERDYPSREAAIAAHHTMLDGLAALPGVRRVSAGTCLPLAGACTGNTVRVEGRSNPPGTIPPFAAFRAVAGGYFESMGIAVRRGRGINRDDVERGLPVVVVNETFERTFFPGQDPIGRRVASNLPPTAPGKAAPIDWLEVVGVVSDIPTARALPAASATQPQLYMPMSIAAGPGMPRSTSLRPDVSVMSYVVRTAVPPLDLLPASRRVVQGFDANLPLAQPRTLQQILDRASGQMAFTMVLLAIAALVALLLGLVGIYGVTSYIVSQRTNEIGVRLALGANPGTVARLIVQQGAVVLLAGIAAGLTGAFAVGKLLESLLYEVSPRDPGVLALTTATLALVSLMACWLPARRAARLSTIEALRVD